MSFMHRCLSRPPALFPALIAAALALGACSAKDEPQAVSAPTRDAAPEMSAKMMAGAPAPMAAAAGGAEAVSPRHIAVSHALEVVVPAAQITEAWKAVADTCAKLDCEVVSSSVRKELRDQPGGAELEMRVNPKDAPQLLGQIDGVGRVASHNTSSEDKTAQVVDVEAHIKNRTEFRDSLRALLQQPGANRKLSDVLDIQQTLSQTQAELDSHATQLKLLMQQTTRQHVQVAFRPEVTLTEGRAANPIWTALRDAGQVMADSVASLITLVAAFIPWLVLLVPLGWALRRAWAWRARRRAPPAA
ncbi:DUF4349 domain-containing protein [Hydrogenophaga sp. SL48]|uniref:DUF4349 domain-containing protein n=1 Tax=Hydrogenophaga sp. SL48 TaxID=2806347 RepID=UPI001F303330|nr:DUF4349 domain-containing protein [Hydrogenophaga sp. SL48]UJW81028.1 DUF4349 domain-containing protein [Hydrogenophaga sp. SL48]